MGVESRICTLRSTRDRAQSVPVSDEAAKHPHVKVAGYRGGAVVEDEETPNSAVISVIATDAHRTEIGKRGYSMDAGK